MKQVWNISQKFFLPLLFMAVVTVAFTSCEKVGQDEDVTYAISGSANGSQMVPSVSGSGSGSINGIYNSRTNILTYQIMWTNLSGTATTAAFWNGTPGTSGSFVANAGITTSGSTGAAVGTRTLKEDEEKELLKGSWYFTVSTPSHASGEIRGQVSSSLD